MSNIVVYSADQVELLKRTIASGATNDELSLFVKQCERTGLDPFTRQIYFIKDKSGKVTVLSSIDGLRLVAERSEKYEGQTKPEWCGDDGVWKDVWTSKELPVAARIGVWKTKFKEPTYGIAMFNEYAGRYSYDDKYGKYKAGDLTHMWNKMPALMISKVAEALALRKAFPNDLSGIYSAEEGEVIDVPKADAMNQKTLASDVTSKPVEALIEPSDLGSYIVQFGKKLSGKALKDIDLNELQGYLDYLSSGAEKNGKPLTGSAAELFEVGNAYLKLQDAAE